MIELILQQLGPIIMASSKIRLVLDDSPTKRYGKKIEGAGYHHNPTPGRTNAKTCFGHSWVVAVLVVTHPLFGEISFPVAAELYLRQKEIDKLKDKYKREFQTKTTMAVNIVKRLTPKFAGFDKPIEVIVDGGYAKDTVLLPLKELCMCTFGIEEVFKDLKEIWGWGKQELRLLESNEAATVMNMLLFGMVELATWHRTSEELIDRKDCPWDDASRRPSHADRRNFLRRSMLLNEFNAALASQSIANKLKSALKRLLNLAV